MFRILRLTSNLNLKNLGTSPPKCQRSEEEEKLWKLTPPPFFFNDSNHWNTSSWHHLQVPEPKLMGNSIMSYSSQHFFLLLFFAFTVIYFDLLDMTNQYFIEFHFRGPSNAHISTRKKKKAQPVGSSLETEDAECFACRILPMTSTYGQGDFSVKLGRGQEMRRVQRLKRLQQLGCTGWKECCLKVGLMQMHHFKKAATELEGSWFLKIAVVSTAILEGHYVEIKTLNFNIYKINEAIIQTQRYVCFSITG